MSKTGDDLINAVNITVTLPNNQVLMTDDRLLSLAQDEIRKTVLPVLIQINQEYFVYQEIDPTVAGKQLYSIPYRAIGRTLRDLKVSNGPNPGDQTADMVLIAAEDMQYYNFASPPSGFCFEGDKIRLAQFPTAAGFFLRKFYLLRPGNITKTDAAGKIIGISGNIITVSTVPMTFANGSTVDFIEGIQGNSTLLMDATITNISGNQITVSSVPDTATGSPGFLSVGDYITLAEQSPVLQLPDEAFGYVVELTSKRVLEAVGDFDGAGTIGKRLSETRKLLQNLCAPRIEGENTKIINRVGLLRGNRFRYRRGFYY